MKPHTSFPVNPLLANGVYMMGYIERLGTGTSDMVEECLKAGLPQPQFIQDSNFRSVIWRKNVHSSAENVHSSVTNKFRLGAKQKLVLKICSKKALTAPEIIESIGLKKNAKTISTYINRLIELGLLIPTTEKANDPKRKYIAKK